MSKRVFLYDVEIGAADNPNEAICVLCNYAEDLYRSFVLRTQGDMNGIACRVACADLMAQQYGKDKFTPCLTERGGSYIYEF